MDKVFMTLSSIFRQHQWHDRPNGSPHILGAFAYDVTCIRCGKSYPIPKKFIDMGWWQGGCPGEKQLLINAMEKKRGK